jgi:retron-type reverse transcriptase
VPQLALSPDSLWRACALAARGKRGSREVAMFLLDGAAACRRLQDELTAGAWRPGEARRFWIHEPKRRLISALPFRDRVVQHLLIAHTLPALERSFAPQSYACRNAKGTHRCLARAQELFRVRRFVLRLDFAKFFPSIDHAELAQLLAPHTPEMWWPITQTILSAPAHIESTRFHFPGDDLFAPDAHPHGLPIGNLTSQVWANLMLTPVDRSLWVLSPSM